MIIKKKDKNPELPNELDLDWPLFTINDVVEVNPKFNRSHITDNLAVSFVPMHAVGAGDGTINVTATRLAGEVMKGFTNFIEGDVLFAKITPCMENGKIAVVPKLINEYGFGSTEFHVLRPKPGVVAKYLYFFISRELFRSNAKHYMTGAVGQKRVPTNYLKQCFIPIPPVEYQKHLVAEIEKQFSRLDEAVAGLKRARSNLKRYKAAILKAAVEGRLTEQWRKEHPDVEPAEKLLRRILVKRRAKWEEAELAKIIAKGKEPNDYKWRGKYKEPTGPVLKGLPPIPATWTWATLPQLGELNRGKSKHRPRNDPKLYGGPYPFVQTGDIRQANGVINNFSQTYSEEGLKQSRLWPIGTLGITIAANIADTAILGFDACFPDSVVGFIPQNEEIDTRFVEFFLRTAKQELERFAPATAQKNINIEILNSFPISLPSTQEQRAIVDEVEGLLSVATITDEAISVSIKRAERLRQSILKKAFSGQLIKNNTDFTKVEESLA